MEPFIQYWEPARPICLHFVFRLQIPLGHYPTIERAYELARTRRVLKVLHAKGTAKCGICPRVRTPDKKEGTRWYVHPDFDQWACSACRVYRDQTGSARPPTLVEEKEAQRITRQTIYTACFGSYEYRSNEIVPMLRAEKRAKSAQQEAADATTGAAAAAGNAARKARKDLCEWIDTLHCYVCNGLIKNKRNP